MIDDLQKLKPHRPLMKAHSPLLAPLVIPTKDREIMVYQSLFKSDLTGISDIIIVHANDSGNRPPSIKGIPIHHLCEEPYHFRGQTFRNVGNAKALGTELAFKMGAKYIVHGDDDAIILNGTIMKFLNLLERNPVLGFVGPAHTLVAFDKRLSERPRIGIATVVYAFRNIGLNCERDLGYWEDHEFIMKFWDNDLISATTPDRLKHKRHTEGGLSYRDPSHPHRVYVNERIPELHPYAKIQNGKRLCWMPKRKAVLKRLGLDFDHVFNA